MKYPYPLTEQKFLGNLLRPNSTLGIKYQKMNEVL